MARKDENNKHHHQYEREHPGSAPGTPHRPDSSYGMDTGKAGGTYGGSDDRPKQDGAEDIPEETPGGQAPEKVEDRPNVSTVKPEDYPAEQRRDSRP